MNFANLQINYTIRKFLIQKLVYINTLSIRDGFDACPPFVLQMDVLRFGHHAKAGYSIKGGFY